MEKTIKIMIEMSPGADCATVTISGMTSEQSSFMTPRLLELMDEMKRQQSSKY